MSGGQNENRCKIVWLENEIFENFFKENLGGTGKLAWVDFSGLENVFKISLGGAGQLGQFHLTGVPEGYVIIDYQYRNDMGAIGLLISHPSFPAVPYGNYYPVLTGVDVVFEQDDFNVPRKVSFREFL